MFAMVAHVREMTSKEPCRYGENRSFGHFCLLFVVCVCVRASARACVCLCVEEGWVGEAIISRQAKVLDGLVGRGAWGRVTGMRGRGVGSREGMCI